MHAPEAYRHWRNHVRDEVKSCSDKPDEAWIWLNEVFDNKTPREKLGNVGWWNKQLLELGVDQAAFVSEPDHMQTTNFLHVGASRLFPCLRDGSKSL
jgi:hypothetical protein